MEEITIEKMKRMHLNGMGSTYQEDLQSGSIAKYTVAEYLAVLTDAEWETRQSRKITNLKRKARFRENAHALNIDYTISRELDKGVMQRLLELGFLKKGENIIITGYTGTGKSYLTQAIGVRACELLYKVVYFTMSTLTDTIQMMKLQGNYARWLKSTQQTPLVIIDDFGLTSIDQQTRKGLLDIIDYKYNKSSMIIASQIPVKEWHKLIGEDTIADAIMDRIVYSSHRIELKGESIRKQKRIVV